MKTILPTLLALFVLTSLSGQTTADFENLGLSPGDFIDRPDSGVFESGNVSLTNVFDEGYMFWSAGWAMSATTDSETPGFPNLSSAKPGVGVDGSATYAITYAFFPEIIDLTGDAVGAPVEGMYVTNSTWAFFAIQDGDSFANKFGGESGDDPDFFLLTIKGVLNGEVKADSVDFYLADYRFDDNTQDYIVDDWEYVDLTSLGNVDQLQLTLRSTDVNANGMLTPAYVCVDNIITTDMPVSTTDQRLDWQVQLGPNPTTGLVQVQWPTFEAGNYQLYNSLGQKVATGIFRAGTNELSLVNMPVGIYHLRYESAGAWNVSQLVRQ